MLEKLEKRKLYEILYILGFCISGIFTMQLLVSNSIDLLGKILAVGMTVVFEFGKGICFMESLRKNNNVKVLLFTLWIALTFLSILASQAFLVNTTNKIENQTIEADRNIKQSEIAQITQQIEDKKTLRNNALKQQEQNSINVEKDKQTLATQVIQYNKDIKNYQSQIEIKNAEMKNAIAKGFYGQQDRISAEIKQLKDQINKTTQARDNLKVIDSPLLAQQITQVNTDIDKLTQQLNNIDLTKYQAKYNDGYVAILQIMGDMLTNNCKLNTLDTTKFWFFLIITIIFEILICTLYYISSIHSPSLFSKAKEIIKNGELGKLQNELKQIDKEIPATCKKSLAPSDVQPILQQNEQKEVARFAPSKSADFCEKVEKYKKVMHETVENEECRGYKWIGNKAGLEQKEARQIFEHLKQVGDIETKNGITMIKK